MPVIMLVARECWLLDIPLRFKGLMCLNSLMPKLPTKLGLYWRRCSSKAAKFSVKNLLLESETNSDNWTSEKPPYFDKVLMMFVLRHVC